MVSPSKRSRWTTDRKKEEGMLLPSRRARGRPHLTFDRPSNRSVRTTGSRIFSSVQTHTFMAHLRPVSPNLTLNATYWVLRHVNLDILSCSTIPTE